MDFEDILQSHDIKIQKGAGAHEIKICCPFCPSYNESADTRFRLGINTKTKWGNCFNCPYKSRHAVEDVLKYINSDFTPDVTIQSDEEEAEETVPSLPIGFEYLQPDAETKSWYQKRALKYLKVREVPKWQITAKKTGVTIVDRFRYRIIWPVVFKKELVGIVGRDFTGQAKAKYLNSVGDKYLYNCPGIRTIDEMVLSEGIFKCLKIERVTGLSSVALLGHSITSLHIEQLTYYKRLKKITVWPDAEKIGIKGAIDVCLKLSDEGYKVYIISPAPAKQADELTDTQVHHKLDAVVPFSSSVEKKLRLQAAFL